MATDSLSPRPPARSPRCLPCAMSIPMGRNSVSHCVHGVVWYHHRKMRNSIMSKRQQIVFLGAGRMATALVKGIIGKGGFKGSLTAYDVSKEAAEAFRKATGASCETRDVGKVLSKADVVVLAVKPQYVKTCLEGARKFLRDKLIVSIAAGVKIEAIERFSGCGRVVRSMPNTPALIGAGGDRHGAFPCRVWR